MPRELLDRVCARVGVDGDAPFTNDSPPLGRPISNADNAAGCPSSATHWSPRLTTAEATKVMRRSLLRALVVGPRSIASTSPTRSLGTRRLTVWRAEWCLSKSPLAPTTSAWGPANFQQTMDTRSACGLVRHALAAATRSSVLFFTRSSSRSSTRSSTRSPLDPPLSSALDPHSMLHSIHVRPLPSYPTALRADNVYCHSRGLPSAG